MTGDSIPNDRQYAKTHEWATAQGEILRVGISDHAQSELTDIVYVELPAVGKRVEAGAVLLVLESVKTVADVYAPATGTVRAVNERLRKEPGLVNQQPYGDGWLVELTLDPGATRPPMLDADGYRASLAAG